MKLIRRLSRNEEHKLMLPEIEESNTSKLSDKIIGYFFYDDDSNIRIRNRINNKEEDENNLYLDNLLNLNDQKRAFFEIENCTDMDSNYKTYRHKLEHTFIYGSFSSRFIKFKEKADITLYTMYEVLTDYSNYLQNKVVIGNQVYKLFKFLRNYDLLSAEDIESITNSKNSSCKNLLCVSRNPIDYIFTATNQNFKSCLNLKNSGQLCGLGLLGLVVDPNRFMIFITQGKLKEHTLIDQIVNHFTYSERWWCLLGRADFIYPLPKYPHKKEADFQIQTEVLKQLDLLPHNQPCSKFKSKYRYKPVKFKDGNISTIYLDKIGFNSNNYGIRYCGEGGISGCPHPYRSPYNFYQLGNSYDLTDLKFICVDCNRLANPDLVFYNHRNDPLCESCYNTHYRACTTCNEIFYLPNMRRGNNLESYCIDCWRDLFFECDHCYTITNNEDKKRGHSGLLLCPTCWTNHCFICCNCDEVFSVYDSFQNKDGDLFCESCYYNEYTFCEECSKEIPSNDKFCDSCLEKRNYVF